MRLDKEGATLIVTCVNLGVFCGNTFKKILDHLKEYNRTLLHYPPPLPPPPKKKERYSDPVSEPEKKGMPLSIGIFRILSVN